MAEAETTVAVSESTRKKLRALKKIKRQNIKDLIAIWAENELAHIKSIATPRGSSATDGVSSPPQSAGSDAAGALNSAAA